MRAKDIKQQLQKLDDEWKAAGFKAPQAGERKQDLARFVSENLETIIAHIKD